MSLWDLRHWMESRTPAWTLLVVLALAIAGYIYLLTRER